MNFNQPQGLENKKIEEIKTPETKIKEGVDFVFEQNPELVHIGTKEQYSEYLDTIFPDSKVKDIVYHGGSKNIIKEGFKIDYKNIGLKEIFFSSIYGAYIRDTKDIIIPVIVNSKKIKVLQQGYKIGETELNRYAKEADTFIKFGLSHVNKKIITEEFDKELDRLHKISGEYIKEVSKFNNKEINSLSELEQEILLQDIVNKYGVNENMPIGEMAVINSEQIHILGSKKDIEEFKNFVSQTKEK